MQAKPTRRVKSSNFTHNTTINRDRTMLGRDPLFIVATMGILWSDISGAARS
jgi:hypothetical protein